MKKFIFLTTMAIVAFSGTASAYTGPGLGMATIAVVIGFFTSLFIALFAIIWYPIKRLIRKRKKTKQAKLDSHGNDVTQKTDSSSEQAD